MTTITATDLGGNWSNGETWVGGVAPTAADDVLLSSSSGDVTIDDGAAVCRSLGCAGYTRTLSFKRTPRSWIRRLVDRLRNRSRKD